MMNQPGVKRSPQRVIRPLEEYEQREKVADSENGKKSAHKIGPLSPRPARTENLALETIPAPETPNAALNWSEILWQAWRQTKDKDYACFLFELLGDMPLGSKQVGLLALIGTLYGLLLGYLIGILGPGHLTETGLAAYSGSFPLVMAWLTGVLGGLAGIWIGRKLSWRHYLSLVTPNVFGNKMGKVGRFNLELGLGFLIGAAGYEFIGGAVAGGLWNLISSLLDLGDKEAKRPPIASALVGGIGAFLGTISMVGGEFGVGLALVLGSWFGLTGGNAPIGLLVSWLGVLLGLVTLGVGNWLVVWLALSVGFGLGLLPTLAGPGIEPDEAYLFRGWYYWWRGHPSAARREQALALAQKHAAHVPPIWAKLLARLEQPGPAAEEAAPLIARLFDSDWMTRFMARRDLVSLGGEAAQPLGELAVDTEDPLQPTAMELLGRIEQETTRQLSWRASLLRCPDCFTRFGARQVKLAWGTFFVYYGCRLCGQSRRFIEAPGGTVALLDETGAKQEPEVDEQGVLKINWLSHRELFDFDRVEIRQVSDELVERFAVQVGNDTDPARVPRYAEMQCTIEPQARLSENTLRILRRIFGRVGR